MMKALSGRGAASVATIRPVLVARTSACRGQPRLGPVLVSTM